ncbi:MAG: hypothetical protein ACKO0Z_05040 [Betaproteobacteria bacterium]
MSKPLYVVWDSTGSRPLSRHRKLSQAGAAYLRTLSRPIIARVYVEFPRGFLGFEIDRTSDAIAEAGKVTNR